MVRSSAVECSAVVFCDSRLENGSDGKWAG